MLRDQEDSDSSSDSLLIRFVECRLCRRNRIRKKVRNTFVQLEPLKDIEILRVIGQGSSGIVCSCLDVKANRKVAIKQIYVDSICNGVPGDIIREVSLLKKLNHPNIVRLFNVYHEGTRIVGLVLEHLDCNLHDYMICNESNSSSINDPMIRKRFLYQILSAVEYLHANNVIHRDLKPRNLLVDCSNKIIKLTDFGLARELGDSDMRYTRSVGTKFYMAPEILFRNDRYSSPVDIWAVGCIFGEMVFGKPILANYNRYELDTIFKIFGTPTEETWPGVTKLSPLLFKSKCPQYKPMDLSTMFSTLDPNGLDLLKRMLCLDPNKRISAEAALKHAYFNDLDLSVNKKTVTTAEEFATTLEADSRTNKNSVEDFTMTMEGGSSTHNNNNNTEELAIMMEGGSTATTNQKEKEFGMTMEGGSNTNNNNAEEIAVGCLLSIRTTFGEEFEGVVVTFDSPSNILVLQEGSKHGPLRNIRLLKANYIKDFTFLGQYEDPLDLENCYLDLNVLQAREELAIRQAEADAEKIGVGVTREAQTIFDALSKTHPVRWDKTDIVVMNEVHISSPYHPNCVIGGTATANDRVKKVLECERKRLQLPVSGGQ